MHDSHTTCTQAFIKAAEEYGKQIVIKTDRDLTLDDTKDKDLIISMGGDHTYLTSSSIAYDCSIPILGINTQILSELGILAGNKMHP